MNRSLFFVFALALSPTIASAQEGPPPLNMAPPTAAQRAQMQQFHAQADQLRMQARSAMLTALTPAHRTAIAAVFGQVALAPNPNFAVAANQLDALLSSPERQSVINAAASERNAMHALEQQQHAAMESTLSAAQRSEMEQRDAQRRQFMASRPHPPTSDPGTILLHTLGKFSSREGWGRHD